MFDLSEVKNDYDLIPDGTKAGAVVSGAEWKVSKAGAEYLQTELTFFEGQYEGRKVWNNLNLNSQNEKARNIALSQLKTLVAGTGEANDQLTKEQVIPAIMESRVNVKVGVQMSSEYGDRNTVKSITPFDATKSASNAPF